VWYDGWKGRYIALDKDGARIRVCLKPMFMGFANWCRTGCNARNIPLFLADGCRFDYSINTPPPPAWKFISGIYSIYSSMMAVTDGRCYSGLMAMNSNFIEQDGLIVEFELDSKVSTEDLSDSIGSRRKNCSTWRDWTKNFPPSNSWLFRAYDIPRSYATSRGALSVWSHSQRQISLSSWWPL
jgi:hypothetical protein